MKTKTETTITGKETILESTMNVAYKVDVSRHNDWATISLYINLMDNKNFKVDSIFKSLKETFEENLNDALEEAKENWKIEKL